MTQPQPFPNLPAPPARPRMHANRTQQVIWTLVPVVSISLLAFLPFVVAAVKGVVKPVVAVAYIVAEAAVLTALVATGPDEPAVWAGMLELVLIITAATHTALLDSEMVKIGKAW